MNTDECSHDCYNNVGSYSCDCAHIGYELDNDDVTCVGKMLYQIILAIVTLIAFS